MFEAIKKTCLTSILAAGAAVIAGPALAQSGSSSFDGAYAGVGLGLTDFDHDVADQDVGDTGFAYEALVGYRRTLDNGLLVGLEGHLGSSDAKDEVVVDVPGSEEYIGTNSLGRSIGIEAVLGTTFGADDRFLGFFSAGYLNQKVTACCVVEDGDAASNILSITDTESGYRIGGGLEYKLVHNLAWRASVHYSDTGRVQQTQAMTGVTVGF